MIRLFFRLLATFVFFTTSPALAESWQEALSRANDLGRQGIAAHRAGKLDQAEQLFRSAIAAIPADTPPNENDRVGIFLREKMAELMSTRGKPKEARQWLDEAKRLSKGDLYSRGHLLNNQGQQEYHQGKLDEAEDNYKKALAIFNKNRWEFDSALTLGNLGLIYLDRYTKSDNSDHDQLDKAERAFAKSLDVMLKYGSKVDIANQWSNIGLVYRNQKKFIQAENAHQEGLNIDREIGNKVGEVDSLGNLGRVAKALGKSDEALTLFHEAYDLASGIHYARGISHHGLNAMTLLNDRGLYRLAEAYGEPTLAAAKSIGHDFTIARILEEMTFIAAKGHGCFASAREFARESQGHFEAADMAEDSQRLKRLLNDLPAAPNLPGCR
ncbi:exported hypothetical protein [Candidatus Terasakiella magnetica]|nr:exported hypothetical protein [Candidatus Terasakiella magnetica]